MHIDHDHAAGGEHSHNHTHSHTHEHTHDGMVHTHEHTHAHTHSHGHPHEHDQLHDADSSHNHPHHTPMDELLALMKYMVGHNAAHAKELVDLAAQLKAVGSDTAYEKVMSAVADFEKGNQQLADVLEELGAQ